MGGAEGGLPAALPTRLGFLGRRELLPTPLPVWVCLEAFGRGRGALSSGCPAHRGCPEPAPPRLCVRGAWPWLCCPRKAAMTVWCSCAGVSPERAVGKVPGRDSQAGHAQRGGGRGRDLGRVMMSPQPFKAGTFPGGGRRGGGGLSHCGRNPPPSTHTHSADLAGTLSPTRWGPGGRRAGHASRGRKRTAVAHSCERLLRAGRPGLTCALGDTAAPPTWATHLEATPDAPGGKAALSVPAVPRARRASARACVCVCVSVLTLPGCDAVRVASGLALRGWLAWHFALSQRPSRFPLGLSRWNLPLRLHGSRSWLCEPAGCVWRGCVTGS